MSFFPRPVRQIFFSYIGFVFYYESDSDCINNKGGKSSPCASDYKGTEPGSEPETHAIQKFILDRAPRWLSFISIHAFGAFWILNREEENFPNKNEFINHVNMTSIMV